MIPELGYPFVVAGTFISNLFLCLLFLLQNNVCQPLFGRRHWAEPFPKISNLIRCTASGLSSPSTGRCLGHPGGDALRYTGELGDMPLRSPMNGWKFNVS
jgi:hypothetical protein